MMYQDHFQLKSQPFSEHAPATSLWVDGRMQEGLARLNYLVTGGTLGLVTGPTGSGKSALLKRFLHELSHQQCESILLSFYSSQFDRLAEAGGLTTGRGAATRQRTTL